LVVAESNLRGFRGLTVDAFGCLLRGGPAQLPNAVRKIAAEHNGDRNARSPEDLWRDTFRKYIRANPFLSFREVHRKTIQDFFEALGIANDVDGCIDAVFHEYRSSSAYPEVSAVLRDLEQEVPVAVVSNMDTTALLEALQRNGLSFTFIITSDEGSVTSRTLRCSRGRSATWVSPPRTCFMSEVLTRRTSLGRH